MNKHVEVPTRTAPLPLEFPGVHYIDEEEIQAAVRVLRSRSLFRYYGVDLQNETQHFEEEFAAFTGVRYALAVGSGTGALAVALSAFGVGPGLEVIVPAYMWVSIPAAVINQGAIPVLADIDDGFSVDPREVERQITPRTAGIVFAHMSGAPGNVQPVRELADKHGLFVLEDCAQCLGGSIGGRKVGSFGHIGIFSFQINKNMTSGEGGAIVTNDERLYRRAFACHDLGYVRDENGRLVFDDPNFCLWGKGTRMDELRAAVLRVQLRKLSKITSAMNGSKYRIRRAFERFPEVQLRTVQDPSGDTGSFLISSYRDSETARRVNRMMRDEGIVTFPQGISDIVMTDWGLHLYSNIASLVQRTSVDSRGFPWNLVENSESKHSYDKGTCPVADRLFERSILLAIPSCLSTADEDDIMWAIDKTLRHCL